MKLIGAFILWLNFAYVGFCISKKLILRKQLYSSLLIFIEIVINEVQYFVKPIYEIIISNSDSLDKNIVLKLSEYMNSGYDFPVAWKKTIAASRMPLNSNEKEKIINMITSLGKADADIQINLLNSYKAHFIKMAEKSEICSAKYSGTVLISSVLLGGAVFIILI